MINGVHYSFLGYDFVWGESEDPFASFADRLKKMEDIETKLWNYGKIGAVFGGSVAIAAISYMVGASMGDDLGICLRNCCAITGGHALAKIAKQNTNYLEMFGVATSVSFAAGVAIGAYAKASIFQAAAAGAAAPAVVAGCSYLGHVVGGSIAMLTQLKMRNPS